MTTRKSFLASASLFTLSAGIAAAATPAPAASPAPAKDPYSFDETRFAAVLSRPAKHKQCFGTTKLNNGDVLDGMQNTINAYVQYLHEAASDTHVAAVLYHGASIGLAFNDSIWNEFITPLLPHAGKTLGEDFSQVPAGKGNPFLHSTTKSSDDVSVERLIAQGGSFFVCHNALSGLAHAAAALLKRPYRPVYEQLLAGVVPGALVVPAGVMAINAAQEAGFTYISAS
ncbi:MAG TPA: hypothetical protein VGZ02_06920 [Candidatus Baltobacteraceae bacterium]|jgi:intracellular sulfur oxidation DsrE/DsrF family protein|nr:hypothetical protein [Candidatus Baltobacteraceae bacterium]